MPCRVHRKGNPFSMLGPDPSVACSLHCPPVGYSAAESNTLSCYINESPTFRTWHTLPQVLKDKGQNLKGGRCWHPRSGVPNRQRERNLGNASIALWNGFGGVLRHYRVTSAFERYADHIPWGRLDGIENSAAGMFRCVSNPFPARLRGGSVTRKQSNRFVKLAEGVGFEPTRPFWGLTVFKTAAFNHSATPPLGF
jgi:hypothetical protein